MYNVSEQFHTAVFENSPTTQILFRFSDGTIFTNEDIHLTSGIKLMEAANYEEELTIGSCLSSTLSATFMNYHGLLSGYAFGECEVSLGIKIGTDTFAPTIANVTAIHDTTVYTGHSTAPYLRVNGSATSEQPIFPVHSIVIYDGELLCIGLEGQTWTSAGFTEPVSASDFMTAKYVAMAKSHLGYDFADDVLRVYSEYGTIEIYEYAKLGVFKIDTPKKRNTNLIAVAAAYDNMQKFDIDASEFFDGLTYPITLGQMFEELCALVGVSYKTSTFTNSTHSINALPSVEADKLTAKDILRWIAEAAGTFARMTRDGKIELAWFAAASVEIPSTQCFKIDMADYSVAVINKLELLDAETGINGVVGSGTNSYLIINNPFLKGVTAGDVYNYGLPIYTKLNAFAAFYPLTVMAVCDWSIQAGDIVSVEFNGDYYDLPIYCQTITWKGDAKVAYESTGSATRPILDAAKRAEYTNGKQLYEVKAGVEAAVKQGEAYNDVTISHANGVVVAASVSGKTINIKMNGQEGLAIYDGTTYKGGVAVVDGEVVVVSNALTNNINGVCHAMIGEVNIDGKLYKGLFLYNTDYSTSKPVLRLITLHSGNNTRIESPDNGYAIQFGKTDDLGNISISSLTHDYAQLCLDYLSAELIAPNSSAKYNALGIDSTGPYKIVNSLKTYL